MKSLFTAKSSRKRENANRLFATESDFAIVISGSAVRRNSLALGKVVRINSWRKSDTVIFLNIALRCELLRFNRRPL